jgi:hypothetical protein
MKTPESSLRRFLLNAVGSFLFSAFLFRMHFVMSLGLPVAFVRRSGLAGLLALTFIIALAVASSIMTAACAVLVFSTHGNLF